MPTQQPSRAKPNLVFLAARTIRIGFDAYEWRESFYESQKNVDPLGVVACFRNEPSSEGRVIEANGVRAQIIYRNQDGQETGIVPRACWLQDCADTVDLPAGESHCVILAILRQDGSLVAPWRRRVTAIDGHRGQVITTEAYQFDKRVSSIEIRILGESNEFLLSPLTFDFCVAEGRPTAVRRP